MAHMPVEVIDIGKVPSPALTQAITLANSLQCEFFFDRLAENDAGQFRMRSFTKVFAPDLLRDMDELRAKIKGHHPFLIAFIDAKLENEEYSNLFAANRSKKGLGIVTIADVPGKILPADRLVSYILYYLAHQTLGFIAPDHKSHEDSRGCVFDLKKKKLELLDSMRAGALCDQCRDALLSVERFSPGQFFALDKLYGASGTLMQGVLDQASAEKKPRIFVGSSSMGLPVAEGIQTLLKDQYELEVWNQGTIFGLGTATLEALESAVLAYDFGIFVFTPDDEAKIRGKVKRVARDNVVFELGLFVGKLTRKRAFVVQPQTGVTLPSDLAGITTASYDPNPNHSDLAAALGPACQQVRNAVAAVHRTNEQAGRL